MTRIHLPLHAMTLAVCALVGTLGACNRQDAASPSAEASQPIDMTNRTRANGSTAGPTGTSPAVRNDGGASDAVSSQSTGTSPMPGEVTRPPQGSPQTAGGTGSSN